MALDNCKAAVRAAVGRDLSKEEEAYVNRNARRFRKKVEAANGDPKALKAILDEAGSRGDALLARAKRDAALQWRALQTLEGRRRDIGFASQNPSAFLQSMFRGSHFDFEGAKNSLAVDVQREGNGRVEALEAELQKNGLHDLADSRDYSTKGAINAAVFDLQNGKALPDVVKQYGLAGKVADTFMRHGDALRTDMNREGAWITENSDRTFRRTHDGNKIAKAGGYDYGSNEARDYWAREQNARMDWDKAFDGELSDAAEKERLDLLRKEYGELASGQHIDFTRDFGQGPRSGRIGQRFSYQRKLVFQSAADDLAYHNQYGKGTTLLENRLNELREGGKVLALMRRLGPRPEETLRKFAANWEDELNDTDPAKAKALADTFRGEMNNTWKLLTGQMGHPNDNFVNRLLASVRHTIGVAKTGMSIFSLPNDMALRASMMGQYSSEYFQGTVTKQIFNIVKSAAGLSKDDKRWLMAQVGSRWEDSTRPIDPNLVDHKGFGALYKFNGMVAKSYGHGWWDNTFRTGAMANDGNIFANEAGSTFDKMSLKGVMQRFGITSKEWDAMRKLPTDKLTDGREVLIPQHILDADLSEFKGIAGKDASDSLLSHTRADLAAKYRNLLGEMADRSTSATSLENQAALGLGEINPNSARAEVMRMLFQLKGWGFNYIRNHLDRELRGYSQDYVSVGQAMRDMMLGRNNRALLGISRLVAKGMAIAYVTNALRDAVSGRTPQNPFDFDTEREKGFFATPGGDAAARAFARQGLGLYTDWLVHSSADDSFAEMAAKGVAGPVISTTFDLGDLAKTVIKQANTVDGLDDARQGKDLQRLYGIGWRAIPGTEAWYSKLGLDALIYNNVSETLNPGYKDRLQKKAEQDGQQYWAGP